MQVYKLNFANMLMNISTILHLSEKTFQKIVFILKLYDSAFHISQIGAQIDRNHIGTWHDFHSRKEDKCKDRSNVASSFHPIHTSIQQKIFSQRGRCPSTDCWERLTNFYIKNFKFVEAINIFQWGLFFYAVKIIFNIAL